jgi:hypothetical protein
VGGLRRVRHLLNQSSVFSIQFENWLLNTED